MNTQVIRTFFIFIIITGVMFLAADNLSPDSDLDSVDGGDSAQFLTLIASLDSVHIDFEFIDALGSRALLTDVLVSDPRPTETGRDNPFKRTGSAAQFSSSRGVVSNLSSFGQGSSPVNTIPGTAVESGSQNNFSNSVLNTGQNVVIPPSFQEEVSEPFPAIEQDSFVVPPEVSENATLLR